ncbi:MAG: RNA polymerase subunit sigma [Acidobacteria bacterium]|nr:RNA polymerase subunit sigma [Acidobacteriota bacterium]MCB9377362.1 RNA polymerase subunit sigma [Holophagales bacterium]
MAPETVAPLLEELAAGDRGALDRLFALLYRELRDLAHRQLARGRPGETLATTALVHEVYLKLSRAATLSANDRNHFFSLAARAMRQVVVDQARRRAAERRPDPARALSLTDAGIAAEAPVEEVLAIDGALRRLEDLDPALGRLVEWRVFAGLTLEQIEPLSGRSLASLKRDWRKARAFLARELGAAA